MANVKPVKSRRKRYATEFLIRTDNEELIVDLKKMADKKETSVNLLAVSILESAVRKNATRLQK